MEWKRSCISRVRRIGIWVYRLLVGEQYLQNQINERNRQIKQAIEQAYQELPGIQYFQEQINERDRQVRTLDKELHREISSTQYLQNQINEKDKQLRQLDKELYHLRGHLLEVTQHLVKYTKEHTLPERASLISALEQINTHIIHEQQRDIPGEISYDDK